MKKAAPRAQSEPVRVKRAYEPLSKGDGFRVLVDRLWPRGISREALAIDAWHKEIAPSDDLRRWFGHGPARWAEFVRRYRAELGAPLAVAVLDGLAQRAKGGVVTLVYAARDEERNNAVVLHDEIVRRLGGKARR